MKLKEYLSTQYKHQNTGISQQKSYEFVPPPLPHLPPPKKKKKYIYIYIYIYVYKAFSGKLKNVLSRLIVTQ